MGMGQNDGKTVKTTKTVIAKRIFFLKDYFKSIYFYLNQIKMAHSTASCFSNSFKEMNIPKLAKCSLFLAFIGELLSLDLLFHYRRDDNDVNADNAVKFLP